MFRSLSLILLIALFFMGGHFFADKIELLSRPNYYEENECNLQSLTLESAADCLHEELSEFYYYNISNLYAKDLTLEELKSEGGVCYQYSNWYCDQAEEIGFHCEAVKISMKENIGHQLSIISNDEGYCILDQTFEPVCYKINSNPPGLSEVLNKG